MYTLGMYITQLSQESPRRGFIVPPQMPPGRVSLNFGTCLPLLTWLALVKIWDTTGEDKILKGEYKVLGGKMYVILFPPSFRDRDG